MAAPGRALGEAAESQLLRVPRKGGDVLSASLLSLCVEVAPRRLSPSTWGPYHLEEPPAQVFQRVLPGRGGGPRPPRRVGAVQRAPGHAPSKGRVQGPDGIMPCMSRLL